MFIGWSVPNCEPLKEWVDATEIFLKASLSVVYKLNTDTEDLGDVKIHKMWCLTSRSLTHT